MNNNNLHDIGKHTRSDNAKARRQFFDDHPEIKLVPAGKAIRLKCRDCSNGQVKEIHNCIVMTCALWPYRMGSKPTIEDLERLAKSKCEEI